MLGTFVNPQSPHQSVSGLPLIGPILQVRKMRHRKVKGLIHSHTARQCYHWSYHLELKTTWFWCPGPLFPYELISQWFLQSYLILTTILKKNIWLAFCRWDSKRFSELGNPGLSHEPRPAAFRSAPRQLLRARRDGRCVPLGWTAPWCSMLHASVSEKLEVQIFRWNFSTGKCQQSMDRFF